MKSVTHTAAIYMRMYERALNKWMNGQNLFFFLFHLKCKCNVNSVYVWKTEVSKPEYTDDVVLHHITLKWWWPEYATGTEKRIKKLLTAEFSFAFNQFFFFCLSLSLLSLECLFMSTFLWNSCSWLFTFLVSRKSSIFWFLTRISKKHFWN